VDLFRARNGLTPSDIWRMPSSGRQAEPLHHNTRADFPTPIDGRTVLYAAKEWDARGRGCGRWMCQAKPAAE
jgi:hypothetical protein